MRPIKKFITERLNQRGNDNVKSLGNEVWHIEDFRRQAQAVVDMRPAPDGGRRRSQKEIRAAHYREVRAPRLLGLLAQVIDPSNFYLFCASQLVHTLQVLESMEKAGITDSDMLVATVIHDLGKLAMLKGELLESIEGAGSVPCATISPVSVSRTARSPRTMPTSCMPASSPPENIAWLLRWHSIRPPLANSCPKLAE